ncbi:hypothetical protein GTA08_BOTSDO08894 [Botryosphaeria dothidea]|uniref:Ankyrin repeat protein n=1 Tax=Botryosphaeria dothidea TaxID=55169 RepID=A0A8H4IL48_9PEZI|nr:hypothetical protein GTA08_BOTSDO08894 [Botryosphaeria dothidea]
MPEETVHLQLQPSKEEDHLIATHLVDRYLPKGRHNEEVRQTVVEKVSENANGSAIWIKMVLEYLRNRHMTNPETMLKALQTVPSKLSEVYGKIFDQIVEREATNQRIIEQALEILAVARRPLTLRELSTAIALDANGEKFTRLSQLEAYVDHQMVLDLTRPFLRTEVSANSIIRLVHHSLKELILQKPPRTWTSDWKVPNRAANTGHVRRMHDILSTRCIQYLRLSELGEKELFPKGRLETGEGDQMFSAFSLFDDEDEAPGKTYHPSSPIRAQHVRDFEPSTEGFGDFFTYAACYWPHHVRNSSDDTSPEPQDLMALASAGSTLLRNWSEQYRRPSCSYSEEQYLPPFEALDPLVIAAYFGRESTAIQLLENYSVKTTDFTSDSAWTATDWALQNGQVSIVRGIFERTGTTLHNWDFFYQVLTRWRDLKASDKDRWDPFFEMLINRMLDQVIEWGPEILCLAAHKGCLPMIRKLFEVGAKIPKLRQAILEDRDREGKHQSVGEAVWWGHADIIHFLCQQDGIEKHLFHRGPSNETVFHAAARFGKPEVFQILLQYYPEGVDLKDDYDTPLHTLVLQHRQGFEAVELLLKTGMVDPNAVTVNGTSPLSTAVNYSEIEMIRTLVAGGADVNSVLGIAANGQPYLKAKPAFPENEERILKELCQLIVTAQPPQRG